jgi:predicted RecA/RadA family phage recombinase
VGLKWRFYENEADKLSLAVKPEIRLWVSEGAESKGLGNGVTNGAVALILTKETGFGAVHANLAVSTFRFKLQENNDIHRETIWRLSVAPVFDIAEGWKVALDAGLVTNPHQAEHAGMGYVELGAIYSPSKDLDFALGFIRDVHHENHRVFAATVGITWRFR